ncbi:hypothetical protein OH76DRAFT_930288 [Lentinus brumalis]|uniref:Uncharacterized protein n=1 Tax=Lentinus brumalis TaxID=2498619 RepID=A0A371CZM9_9APHY|nr:hypothetical protein OH76DRAFT_930288 [Polyporus brumalis]
MTHVPQDAYLKHELVAMLQSCMVLSSAEIHIAALKPLLKARIDYVMQRQIHAAYLDAWENLKYCNPEGQSEGIERRARVHSLIRMNKHLEQPPSHEVGEVYDSDEEPYDDECQMDPKDLAPEVVKRPFPKSLDNLYEEYRWHEDRDGISYDALLQARYKELEDCYDELVETCLEAEGYDLRTLPPTYNAARTWTMLSWKDGARSEIDFDTFLIYTGGLDEGFKTYRVDMQRALASQVDWPACNGRWDHPDVLAQPAALFICRECHRPPLPWPDINKH